MTCPHPRRWLVVLMLVTAGAVCRPAEAQRLTIAGDRFAVDGAPRFLTFISYFGVMEIDDVDEDLAFLKNAGFDGVRIWPNWRDGPPLMRSDGTLIATAIERLHRVLDSARAHRLVVDVTFTAEEIPGLDAPQYLRAVTAAVEELKPYDNLLVDIHNERDVHGPFGRRLAADDVTSIAAAVKAADPNRIVTASNSPNTSPESAAQFTVDAGLDVTAYHEDRGANWYKAEQIERVVTALKRNGRPAYLQEPTRFPFPSTDRSDYFRIARMNAKRAGAAAWCFHTELGFDVRDTTFKRRLAARVQPEWSFVSELVARIHLRTSDGMHYLVAEGGGGGAVLADRRFPGPWETLTFTSIDGGPVFAGDRVSLGASDGHFFRAEAGGGGALTATAEAVGAWETFVVETNHAGPIADGDQIALRTDTDPPWYITADQSGGASVAVVGHAAGPWETFEVIVAAAASELRLPIPDLTGIGRFDADCRRAGRLGIAGDDQK
jgi:hypothetical protein